MKQPRPKTACVRVPVHIIQWAEAQAEHRRRTTGRPVTANQVIRETLEQALKR